MIKLMELNYNFKDLEPVIDSKTVEIHHTKHHQAYVDNLNAFLKQEGLENNTLEEILEKISTLSQNTKKGINNNAGGVFLHNVYFEQFSKEPKEANGDFLEEVNKKYGSMDGMIEELKTKALTQFGSGWSVLVVDTQTKDLDVVQIANQDVAPLISNGKIPIAAFDVWEHAYYLKYQNKRAEYLENLPSIIDWGLVSEKYSKLKK